MTVVAWLGPAAAYQAPGWKAPAGAAVLNLQCKGNDSPSCGEIADGWLDLQGRRLPRMLASRGLDLAQAGDVLLNAFSAGGSSVKRLCMDATDRAAITAVVLADAFYTTELTPSGAPIAPEGFVRYALDAIVERRLMIATVSSNPNKQWPNGSEVLEAVRLEVEKRSGRQFEPGGVLPLPVQPETLWRLGNVVLADYKGKLAHGEHVSVLNAPIWEAMVLPWLKGEVASSGDKPPGVEPVAGASSSGSWGIAWLLGGAAAGFLGARAFLRRRA